MTVWIYVDNKYQVGHPDHLKVFADQETADKWFHENDCEGTAFGYEVITKPGPTRYRDASG
jgi:hypothetical protein